jgi:hypothetical protein
MPTCDDVLARVHEIVQPGNYPSNLTRDYVILPSRATFSTAATALAALTSAHA